MHEQNLTIMDKNGNIESVPYAFADDGKVFRDNTGNTCSSVEMERIDEYEEVVFTDDEIDDTEAIAILTGEEQ